MDRVYESGAVEVAPAAPASNAPRGFPAGGNPMTGQRATRPGAWWYHMITEELRAVIVEAGLEPNAAETTQLLSAIRRLLPPQTDLTPLYQAIAAHAQAPNPHAQYLRDLDLNPLRQAVAAAAADIAAHKSATDPHPQYNRSDVQVGAMIIWPAAAGWDWRYMRAVGQMLSPTAYPELYNVYGVTHGETRIDGVLTGFGVPDMRGVFPRGWDDGRGLDPGRALSSLQFSQNASHQHRYQKGPHTAAPPWSDDAIGWGLFGGGTPDDPAYLGHTELSGGSESRPVNLAVNFLIRWTA